MASSQAAKQDPSERTKNFKEVVFGYTEEQALAEASRCLTCSNPQCVIGCPVGVDIPAFIKLIKEKKYTEAISKIKEKNSLPSHMREGLPSRRAMPKKLHHGQKRQARLNRAA